MKRSLLTKLLSLLLVLTLLAGSASLFSCGGGETPPPNPPENPEEGPDAPEGEGSYLDKVIVPPIKEYDRKTIKYSDIVYSRPNFEALCASFVEITEAVIAGQTAPDDIIERIEALEPTFTEALTMRAIATVNNYKDTSVTYWNSEIEYIGTSYPTFAQKVEDLFVAAAKSEDAEYYEANYFGEGLIENYADGGDYTDELVALLAEEATLEASYNSISTATVEITYLGETKTAEEFINAAKTKYGEGSREFLQYYNVYYSLYNSKYQTMSKDIYLELLKVRRNIAEELDYTNYYDYAFEAIGHEYTVAEAREFLNSISKYVTEVYTANQNSLAPYLYSFYFNTTSADRLELDKLVNGGYKALEQTDAELFEIYQYMLQFSLFDINSASANRYNGAFTTYFENYEAPYLFLTADEFNTDFITLFHEFGHFSEYYTNGSANISIDLQEVFSQSLELLMLEKLGESISAEQMKYLSNKAICNAMETLLYQGFYARFEELAYSLPTARLTEAELDAIAKEVAADFGLDPSRISFSSIIIPHLVTSPAYVISYCTSVVPALELYLLEEEQSGAGFAAYKAMLNRENAEMTFTEVIALADLTGPFKKDYLKELVNEIYHSVMGVYYYEGKSNGLGAA